MNRIPRVGSFGSLFRTCDAGADARHVRTSFIEENRVGVWRVAGTITEQGYARLYDPHSEVRPVLDPDVYI